MRKTRMRWVIWHGVVRSYQFQRYVHAGAPQVHSVLVYEVLLSATVSHAMKNKYEVQETRPRCRYKSFEVYTRIVFQVMDVTSQLYHEPVIFEIMGRTNST